MTRQMRTTHGMKLTLIVSAFWLGTLWAGQAVAGGLLLYEVGTADIGLASAGYNARAQDASTVFTNPAGMTRLEGTQFLAGGQILYGKAEFSMGPGTSSPLGTNEGGNAFGSNGWFPGGGAFVSYSVAPDIKVGLAMTGNFGLSEQYDDNWVGRYYVQEATLIGLSFLPSIAAKVTDQFSVGASFNAMYGKYKNQVAINIPDALRPGVVVPIRRAEGDAQLNLDDSTWGWGATLGLLYEFSAGTRIGFTWVSQVNLDFSGPAEFSNLGQLGNTLQARGLLNANIEVDIKVPQQLMLSVFHQVNPRWAVMGSVGWQQWSKFGQTELGINDTNNPTTLTKNLDFKDTWHFAVGAQYQLSDPWLLNFGMAYDSGIQSSSNVSPLLPIGPAWRFGVGAQNQYSKTFTWGVAAEYMYSGTLDVNRQSNVPVALGGRGDLVGSYNNVYTLFFGIYGSWKF